MNRIIGSNGLPRDVSTELADLVARLEERYYFKNGSTAAFLQLTWALEQHLGERKE